MKTSITTRSSSKKENDSNDVTVMAEEEGLALVGIKRGQGLNNRSNLVWIVSVLVIVAVTVGVIWSPIVNNVDNMDHNVDHKAYWQNEYDHPEKGTILEPVCFVSGRDRNPIAVASYNETHMVIDSNIVWERSGTVCTGQQNTVPDKRTLRANRALLCRERPLDCPATVWTMGEREQRGYKGHIHCGTNNGVQVHENKGGMRFVRKNYEMEENFVIEHGSDAVCTHWVKQVKSHDMLNVYGKIIMTHGAYDCNGNNAECMSETDICHHTTSTIGTCGLDRPFT